MKPTLLISGQSVCSGCGSEKMSGLKELLLTKSTRVTGETCRLLGLTPVDVIVIVEPGTGVGVGSDGSDDADLLLHAARHIAAARQAKAGPVIVFSFGIP